MNTTNYEKQTGLGAVAKRVGVGAYPVPIIIYVERDPAGTLCPACTNALNWVQAQPVGNITAPPGYTDAGGFALKFNDDPGMPAEMLAKLQSIGVNSENYPTADIGGTIVTGFAQDIWDKTLAQSGGPNPPTPPTPPGGTSTGMSTGTKVAIVGAAAAAVAGAAYLATKKTKHRRRRHKR